MQRIEEKKLTSETGLVTLGSMFKKSASSGASVALENKNNKPYILKQTIEGLFLGAPYSDAYCAVRRNRGIHLTQQSKYNLKKLVKEMNPLSKDERILFKIWQEKLVPEFTLKHGTNIEFDELVPQTIREKKVTLFLIATLGEVMSGGMFHTSF